MLLNFLLSLHNSSVFQVTGRANASPNRQYAMAYMTALTDLMNQIVQPHWKSPEFTHIIEE